MQFLLTIGAMIPALERPQRDTAMSGGSFGSKPVADCRLPCGNLGISRAGEAATMR